MRSLIFLYMFVLVPHLRYRKRCVELVEQALKQLTEKVPAIDPV